MDGSIEARITKLEIRAMLDDLVAEYFAKVDDRDVPGVANLFSADATFDAPTVTQHGIDQIGSFFSTRLPLFEFTFHYPHAQTFQVDSDSTATGVITGHAEHAIDGTCYLAALKYEDSYVKDGARWRFGSRRVRNLYFLPWSELATAYRKGNTTGRPI